MSVHLHSSTLHVVLGNSSLNRISINIPTLMTLDYAVISKLPLSRPTKPVTLLKRIFKIIQQHSQPVPSSRLRLQYWERRSGLDRRRGEMGFVIFVSLVVKRQIGWYLHSSIESIQTYRYYTVERSMSCTIKHSVKTSILPSNLEKHVLCTWSSHSALKL